MWSTENFTWSTRKFQLCATLRLHALSPCSTPRDFCYYKSMWSFFNIVHLIVEFTFAIDHLLVTNASTSDPQNHETNYRVSLFLRATSHPVRLSPEDAVDSLRPREHRLQTPPSGGPHCARRHFTKALQLQDWIEFEFCVILWSN
jgi:hypothetical protein